MVRFKPELVIISAGFDSRIDDPLGDFLLEDTHFAELTEIMRTIADQYADGRVISVLEGGYHINGLSKACTAHLGAMH
jgi:acetoin utilization deacetylase AcuC-like enzyme